MRRAGYLALGMGMAAIAAISCAQDGQPPVETSPEAARHVAEARRIGGSDLATSARLLCLPSRQTIAFMVADAKSHPPEAPAKVFDNLYFIGTRSVTAWAIKTSAGLIVIDSLNNADDARTYIAGGLTKLGLDPKDIKYVFISHAHGDHYGGAQFLKDTYGARLLASDADWEQMKTPLPGRGPENWGPPPAKDMSVTDGQKFTLGDTTITLVLTPGHTPGTVSFLIPVKDGGRPHMAALWGGTGQPAAGPANDQYERSLAHFATYTKAAKVNVAISNHPLVDGTIERLEKMKAGPATNPFIIGEATYARYMAIHKECLLAARERGPQR